MVDQNFNHRPRVNLGALRLIGPGVYIAAAVVVFGCISYLVSVRSQSAIIVQSAPSASSESEISSSVSPSMADNPAEVLAPAENDTRANTKSVVKDKHNIGSYRQNSLLSVKHKRLSPYSRIMPIRQEAISGVKIKIYKKIRK